MNDNKNIKLIKEALIAYENGAVLECRDMLAEVVNCIDAFEIAMELSDGELSV